MKGPPWQLMWSHAPLAVAAQSKAVLAPRVPNDWHRGQLVPPVLVPEVEVMLRGRRGAGQRAGGEGGDEPPCWSMKLQRRPSMGDKQRNSRNRRRKRRPEMLRHQRWQTWAGGGADEARWLGPRVAEESLLHKILQQRHAPCFAGARRRQAGGRRRSEGFGRRRKRRGRAAPAQRRVFWDCWAGLTRLRHVDRAGLHVDLTGQRDKHNL